MAKKHRSRKKAAAQYYALPITGKEFSLFREDMSPDAIKGALRRATVGSRPPKTNYFIFVVAKDDAVYCFVVSKKTPRDNKVIFVDEPVGFVDELFDRMRAIYPQQKSDTVLDLGVRNELDIIMSRADIIGIAHPRGHEPDVASFYAKEIEAYVNDISKPVGEAQLRQIVAKKRAELVQRHVNDPSLPLTSVSRKNRPIIARARQEHLRAERQREQAQRRGMARQDVAPLPRQARQALQRHGDNAEELADDLLWRELGLIDPISLERIREPVVLPSRSLMDRSSVASVRLSGRDPMTNLPLGQGTRLQVRLPVKKVIDTLSQESGAVVQDQRLTAPEKARHLIALRQSHKPKLDEALATDTK